MSRRNATKLDGLMELLGRLKSVWASQGIECGVPATQAELAEFEEHYRVCLPDDLREYFLRINGMARNKWWQWDEDLINFYPLAHLVRCDEATGPTVRFIFADHSISAHEYAVELLITAAPSPSGAIYAIGSGPVLIARTFSEFLTRYLR